jgi:hypothetical protein
MAFAKPICRTTLTSLASFNIYMRQSAQSLRDPGDDLAPDRFRKLVKQLTISLARGSGANLTPEAVDIALAALRAYPRARAPRRAADAVVSFQIESLDDLNLPRKVLAIVFDESVAHAGLAVAKKQFSDKSIVLRGTTSSGERIAPVVRRARRAVRQERA